jgi:hypothetical protein
MKALLGSGSGPSLTSPYYLDPTSAIGEALRQSLPGAELPLPITLLLDERRVVRQVLIGALGDRRSELISGISDLLYQLRAASPGHPPPPSGKELRP